MKIKMKKILLAPLCAVVVIAGVATFAAFEAHVINVTATIENALNITPDTEGFAFGTVFPQEELYRDLTISLSDSFVAEGRVDDVSYVIKQKPKVKGCDVNLDADPWKEITVGGVTTTAHEYCLKNVPVNSPIEYNSTDEYYTYCYVPLANYLSKHKADDENPENDTIVDAPHYAYEWDASSGKSSLRDDGIAEGYLSKIDGDTEDKWIIDLKVPCFQGMCDQDPLMPPKWWLDPDAEHKEFGTDLWIEIIDISMSFECSDGRDNDGDNLIDADDPECNDAGGTYHPEWDDEANPPD